MMGVLVYSGLGFTILLNIALACNDCVRWHCSPSLLLTLQAATSRHCLVLKDVQKAEKLREAKVWVKCPASKASLFEPQVTF